MMIEWILGPIFALFSLLFLLWTLQKRLVTLREWRKIADCYPLADKKLPKPRIMFSFIYLNGNIAEVLKNVSIASDYEGVYLKIYFFKGAFVPFSEFEMLPYSNFWGQWIKIKLKNPQCAVLHVSKRVSKIFMPNTL